MPLHPTLPQQQLPILSSYWQNPVNTHARTHRQTRERRRFFYLCFNSTSPFWFYITVKAAVDAGGFPLFSTLFRTCFLPDSGSAVSCISIGCHLSNLFKIPPIGHPRAVATPSHGAVFVEGSGFTAVISPSAALLARPPSVPSFTSCPPSLLCCKMAALMIPCHFNLQFGD